MKEGERDRELEREIGERVSREREWASVRK